MLFTLEIWYRQGGEKYHEWISQEAINIHTAFKIIKEKELGRHCFVIEYTQVIDSQKVGPTFKPFSVNIKDENFEKPISNLYKYYT